jgi:hypothetical protein
MHLEKQEKQIASQNPRNRVGSLGKMMVGDGWRRLSYYMLLYVIVHIHKQ